MRRSCAPLRFMDQVSHALHTHTGEKMKAGKEMREGERRQTPRGLWLEPRQLIYWKVKCFGPD